MARIGSFYQIERAYGPNHAILDNCHVRVAFATNDERTARRISDALGTATQMRAMANYAGHRLSPWLGHLMVSRQETARPLLTPGEVMQLAPDEALVLVAGAPPIRAAKIRYYADPRLAGRVCALDRSAATVLKSAEPSCWTAVVLGTAGAASPGGAQSDQGGLKREPDLDGPELPPPPGSAEGPGPGDAPRGDGAPQAPHLQRLAGAPRQEGLDHDDIPMSREP